VSGEGGHRRKSGKMKTMPIVESEATHVGAAPPGWELETTIVGAPPGWEPPAEAVDVPADWEAERTMEDMVAGPPAPPPHPSQRQKSQERTLPGPEPSQELGARDQHAKQPDKTRSSAPASRPQIEVEVRKVSSAASVARRTPPAYEVWTKNRVYALDATMTCIDVIDLASGQSDRRHPFIGGQLVGGQRRVHDSNELTFPLPTPSSEAVFQTRDAAGRVRLVVTSRVTRVILHVQVVKVAEQSRDTTWNQITSTRHPEIKI
jgi:hypothetical protein